MAVAEEVVAGLSLGLALAGAPGPVQAVLLSEAVRGGIARGLKALAGAAITFGLLLVSLALGMSVAPPQGPVLRILQVIGGSFLVWIAVDGFRAASEGTRPTPNRRALWPPMRGALSVILNPGAWLFLGAVASPLFASASAAAGTSGAVLVALALQLGVTTGDGVVVLLGGVGLRRAGDVVTRWVRRVLAILLAGLGLWLLIQALVPR